METGERGDGEGENEEDRKDRRGKEIKERETRRDERGQRRRGERGQRTEGQKKFAGSGFDPPTPGLWAQYASAYGQVFDLRKTIGANQRTCD